jgi:hypothetical protein
MSMTQYSFSYWKVIKCLFCKHCTHKGNYENEGRINNDESITCLSPSQQISFSLLWTHFHLLLKQLMADSVIFYC